MISTFIALALYLGFVQKSARRWLHFMLLFSVSGIVKLLELLDDLSIHMLKHYLKAAFQLIAS